MALIARKSGGLIPILSGEEVTVSGLKSTLCMLLCVHLLAAWLRNFMTTAGESPRLQMNRLSELPDVLTDMLEEEAFTAFAAEVAEMNRRSHACIVIGDYHSAAACREAAFKLEENSWVAVGKPLDYSEVMPEEYRHDPKGHLVLINVTRWSRLDEAMDLMARFYAVGVPFAALMAEGTPRQDEIAKYSNGYCLCLPGAGAISAAVCGRAFRYMFTYEFAKIRGRKPDEFPRNRAKSVTAGRRPGNSAASPGRRIPQPRRPQPPIVRILRSGGRQRRNRLGGGGVSG
jgi:glucosamine 6-phosphate synthetase-like amidotransferase/phosphosugar isomerase protein